MSWWLLLLAGALEIAWAVSLKFSAGYAKPIPSLIALVSMALAVGCLNLALRERPLGLAYATWVGIGVVGTTLMGVLLFDEPGTLVQWACLGLILTGLIGLQMSATAR